MDFFAVSKELTAAVKGGSAMHPQAGEYSTLDTVPWGPRSAVTLRLLAKPRQVMSIKLKEPKPLPSDKYDGSCGEKNLEVAQGAADVLLNHGRNHG